MKPKTAGILSVILFGMASSIGIVYAFLNGAIAGIITLIVLCFAVFVMLYSFCTSCSCYKNCPHVIPGLVISATKARQPHPYRIHELVETIAGIILAVAISHIWIIWHPLPLGIYWILSILAMIIVRFYVCPECAHLCCPVNPNNSTSER